MLVSFPSVPALAAPFGIEQGAKISSLDVLRKRGTKTYDVQPIERNSNFDTYGVMATPAHGVCAVFARTKAVASWAQAKAKRDEVAKLLSKYGKPHHVKPDANDLRALAARPPIDSFDLEWRDQLAPPLSAVLLDVTSSHDGLVVGLTYFYRNIAQCSNWNPKQDSRGL